MSSGPVRPRHVCHRGAVLASGVAIDAIDAVSRVLAVAEPGSDVFRLGDVFVVRLPAPVRVRCDAAPGAPLVRYGALLSAAPLDADEIAALAGATSATSATSAEATVVFVAGGVASVMSANDGDRVDLASWIDVGDFEVDAAPSPLGAVASAPLAAWVAPPADVRSALGVSPLAADGTALRDALARLGGNGGLANRKAPAVATASAFLRAVASLVGAIASLLRRGEDAGASASRRRPRSKRTDAAGQEPASSAASASWIARAFAAIRRAVASALADSRLGSLVGRAHAKYFARLLAMFDDDDLDGALLHAIPLTDDVASALASPALLPPSPRTAFSIVPRRNPASTSVGLGGGLFDELKRKYRRAFDRLVARGDFEKAAFVLAELLNASEEAVSFLERHGRLTLAAEVAEARGLPPGLVVRQWFIAGDRARAVRIARRTGAFADAVARLERSGSDAAPALRLAWAVSLAVAGAYAAAVDVAWPLAEARGVAGAWIDRAIAVGGRTGARMLVRKLRIDPASFVEVRDRVVAELDVDGDDPRAVAEALAEEIFAGPVQIARGHVRSSVLQGPVPVARGHVDEIGVVAKIAARFLLGRLRDGEGRGTIDRLVGASGDAVFRADVQGGRKVAAEERTPAIDVDAFALTHTGDVRAANEDACYAAFADAPAPAADTMALSGSSARRGIVLGAFDAMGGGSSGYFASELALRTVAGDLAQAVREHGEGGVPWAERLTAALDHANRAIHHEATTNVVRRGTGCAATVAALDGGALLFAQIGDTRGYLFRAGRLTQVTTDHSLLNLYMAAGHLKTPEEIEEFPHKNVVTQVLGMSDEVSIDVVRVPLRRGDVVLLCSDGLSSVIDEAAIAACLTGRAPRAACEALLAATLEAGSPDNVTIVVAKMDGRDLSAVDAQSQVVADGPTAGAQPRAAVDSSTAVVPVPVRVHAVDVPLLRGAPSSVRIGRQRADAGAFAVHDAALLPDGKILVALGEVGAWLFARDGRVLVRFDEPAHELVVSDHGDRAILVAHRGEARRLARVDLVSRHVRAWRDARFESHAATFDGSIWYVSREEAIFGVDALSDAWEHVWRVATEAGAVHAIARDAKCMQAWVQRDETRGEIWSFELPSHTLRQRRDVATPDAEGAPSGRRWIPRGAARVSSGGIFAGFRRNDDDTAFEASVLARGAWRTVAFEPDGSRRAAPGTLDGSPRAPSQLVPRAPQVSDDWLALRRDEPDAMVIDLFDTRTLRPRAALRLELSTRGAPGAGERFARFQGDDMIVFDGAGRVLVVSLADGAVRRELRVR